MSRAPSPAHLLAFLDESRQQLGPDLLRRNPRAGLAHGQRLHTAVQHLLERALVSRFAEQRGLDPTAHSPGLLADAPLFQPHFADDLAVDPEWGDRFHHALDHGAVGRSFAALDIESFGEIYEHSLGRVLVPQGRKVRLTPNPAARKAGGVFYTPRHLTAYVVEQTLGRQLAGRPLREAARLRVLDPACGSGAFLLRAYARLLEHHRQHYTAHPRSRRRADCTVDAAGEVRLTFALKRRILCAQLHGVDLDPQALAIARLSLHLQLLEGETPDSLRRARAQLRGEPLLPPLEENLRCFNALVATDFSSSTAILRRVHAGDWTAHFPAIMARGGFDTVVGNPPYVFGEHVPPALRRYLKSRYATAGGQLDLYHLFFEQSLRLTRPGGYHGYIVPDSILARDEPAPLRRALLERHRLCALAHPGQVFPGAGVSVVAICTQAHVAVCRPCPLHRVEAGRPAIAERTLDPRRFRSDPLRRFVFDTDAATHALLRKLRSCPARLGDFCALSRGEELGKKHFTRASRLTAGREWIRVGADVHRYCLAAPQFLLRPGAVRKDRSLYAGPKLVIVKTGSRPQAALDATDTVTMQSLYNVHAKSPDADLRVFLAVINSTLVAWYLRKTVTAAKKLFPQFNQGHFESLPLPALDAATRRRLARLVGQRNNAKLERTRIRLDREIDAVVFAAYGLTPEERALVATPPVQPTVPQPGTSSIRK